MLWISLIAFLLGGLMTNQPAQQTLSQDNTDQQSIRRLTENWLAAINSKNIPQLTNMVTEDAIFLPPGYPPIRGRQAVQAMFESFFKQFSSVEQTVSVEEVEIAGDWAYTWGTENLTVVPLAGGTPLHMQGKGMSILRRQPDGSWKFARGINNSLPVKATQTQ
jgi:uncharacterized protein (TIGR02246 family)